MKRFLVVLGVAGAALFTQDLVAIAAFGDSCDQFAKSCPTTMVDGYRYSWDGKQLTRFVATQARSQSSKGVVIETRLVAACSSNQPDGPLPGDVLCLGASIGCPPDELRMTVWQRQVDPPPPTDAWQLGTPSERCVGGAQTWDLPELTALLREELYERVRDPKVRVDPGASSLTRLPVIASAERPDAPDPYAEIGFDTTEPLPGRLVATPDYEWDFGGEASVRGAGNAFDGTLPSEDPAHYEVTHTFTTTGRKTVALTVTWRATFSVAGYDIALEPLERDPVTAEVLVRTTDPELVSGQGG